MIRIEHANDVESIGGVRSLLEEYQQSLGIDLDFQDFASELVTLPGEYAPPLGRLLLARNASVVAGCVALRPLAGTTSEMKRLFVRPQSRGLSLGKQLALCVIAEARAIGYRRIYLDTLPTMLPAQRLYESLGFKDIAAYRYNPVAGARFFSLEL
jgi:ribosomal protein S18 acetylase RimI-like enzyme